MALKNWSTTAASNATVDSISWAEGQAPSTVNNSARAEMADVRAWYEDYEWRDFGHTPTYLSATSFSVTGDKTATYLVNRPIRCTDSSTVYGIITASSYAAVTTVTVALVSGSLSASLSAVSVGHSPTNQVIPYGAVAWKMVDDGASEGPTIDLERISASPVASDQIGTITFSGRDSGGAKQTYGQMYAVISDPTAASEDSTLYVKNVVAGAQTNALTIGETIATPKAYYVGSGGLPVQAVEATPITSQITLSTTGAIPSDDTIPQNTEGTEIITVTITPKATTHRLLIEFIVNFAYISSGNEVVYALFQDSTANALAAGMVYATAADSVWGPIIFSHEMAAGTTSATTFKIRASVSTSNAYFNGDGTRLFGGVSATRLRVTEWAA